ncbi:hypothetical protein [Sphingomonas desiccabilis]|uniref:Uncharacterized protein n=1 Tax=Sphingomonas desiccabilis TaxID=429134 RepID=A0A4Q2J031_9SPHN|nr:hypothetical protein [Sphingomonas desiccabilis]MBB3910507.1 hypothetical protein [Sphingomonas desiccabilis]RXZ35148.1 hypothetical protein EO081_05795 [Sphingomonas desiccabilis]
MSPHVAGQTEPKNRLGMGDRARRITLLRGAADLFGTARAAAALGIEQRSFRAKLEATRSVAVADLHAMADALDRHAAAATAHAATIRDNLADRKDAA